MSGSDSPGNETMKRTPLYAQHLALGGKMVPFAGWEMPVQYSGVIPEHNAVRQAAGLFDVSHMGELLVTGPEAEKLIMSLTCNDLSKIYDGKAQYNALINPQGGVVDDIIVYRYASDRFFICVNASNTDKDFEWIRTHNPYKAEVVNLSSEYGQIALQGPRALEIFSGLKGAATALNLKYFHFTDATLEGLKCIVARTGYTGEDGFEIFVPWASTQVLWDKLLSISSQGSCGLVPVGLGARDSLRLEACYPLHGHELADDISALESGLGWIIKLEKGDFIGRAVLAQQVKQGPVRSLVGFYVEDAGIVRAGDILVSDSGEQIGICTSGTKTPTVNRALGLGLVKSNFAAVDSCFLAQVRGRNLKVRVVKRPFYSALKK